MHWDEETSYSALCQGFFCPEGSSAPEPCEEGTYSSRPGLREVSECVPCDGGKYCTGVGKIKPSGNCEGGFYCRQQSISAVRAFDESGHLFRALITIRCTDMFLSLLRSLLMDRVEACVLLEVSALQGQLTHSPVLQAHSATALALNMSSSVSSVLQGTTYCSTFHKA